MVRRLWFIWIVVASAFACAPLIGLDDLHERVAASTPDDAGDGGGDAGARCVSNAQCIAEASAPALCVSSRCVRVDTQLCSPEILPKREQIAKDNVVVFAAFLPQVSWPASGPGLSYRLAMEEIDQAGGIPTDPRRDVALLVCASEPDKVEAAVAHVVNDLHVPAMIANFGSADMTKFVKDFAVPAKVFTLNPNVAAEPLKTENVGQLVWNLLGTPEDVALAYRPLLAQTERYLRGPSRPFDAGAPLEVVLAATDTSLETSMQTVMRTGALLVSGPQAGTRDTSKALLFNDASVVENEANAHFAYVAIPAVETGAKPDYDAIATSIVQHRPDVVILVTAEEAEHVVPAVEKKMVENGRPAPMWIFAPRNATELGKYSADSGSAASFEMKDRMLGIQYAGALDTTERKAWLGRMRARYGDKLAESTYSATENFYDAAYWLVYGLAAAGPGAPPTGESIRDGVRRLLPGVTTVRPGPADTIAAAFASIKTERGGVKFVGALGPPDIDTAFGIWNSVGGVYCYEQRVEDGVLVPVYDVLRYDRASGGLVEAPDAGFCFSGFKQ